MTLAASAPTAPVAVHGALPELAHHQVLQRTTPLGTSVKLDAGVPPGASVRLLGRHGLPVSDASRNERGELDLWLPTGGPYDVVVEGDGRGVLAADVFVGDVWVLAGQSNMEGCGRLYGVEAPSAEVRVFDMVGSWRIAQEPLHMRWLSKYPVHARLEAERQAEASSAVQDGPVVAYVDYQIDETDPTVNGFAIGAGPGVAFANDLNKRTGVPIGLVPAAHGGTSMAQWSPELGADGSSLFGALLESVAAAGGHVAGLLWYQGESECDPQRDYTYDADLARLFAAFRERLASPHLPIIAVQLGRFALPGRPASVDHVWSRVRESQRLCAAATNVVTAVDLELDDPIHIGTRGQMRLGRRLARVAAGGEAIALQSAEVARDGFAVDVRFTGAVGQLGGSDGRVTGFSVRRADGVDQAAVFAAEDLPEGDGFRLRLSRRLEPGDLLFYGYGADPYCNVVDEEDMAAPAFGPIELLPA